MIIKHGTNTGNVNLDYIQMGQLMSINITKYFSLMFGAQTAYLISAKVDSSTNKQYRQRARQIRSWICITALIMVMPVGVEIHPVSGLLIGARVQCQPWQSCIKMLQSFQMPSFTSDGCKK